MLILLVEIGFVVAVGEVDDSSPDDPAVVRCTITTHEPAEDSTSNCSIDCVTPALRRPEINRRIIQVPTRRMIVVSIGLGSKVSLEASN